MSYCYKSISPGYAYYLGFKGKGEVGCIGQYYDDSNCVGNGLGPEFFNIGGTGTSYWSPSWIPSITAYGTAHSLYITCASYNGAGALDEIFLNRGSSTGF